MLDLSLLLDALMPDVRDLERLFRWAGWSRYQAKTEISRLKQVEAQI
ncbi:MAG: hypothetical protein WBX11_17730 [Thiobacillaceae bacterium]